MWEDVEKARKEQQGVNRHLATWRQYLEARKRPRPRGMGCGGALESIGCALGWHADNRRPAGVSPGRRVCIHACTAWS